MAPPPSPSGGAIIKNMFKKVIYRDINYCFYYPDKIEVSVSASKGHRELIWLQIGLSMSAHYFFWLVYSLYSEVSANFCDCVAVLYIFPANSCPVQILIQMPIARGCKIHLRYKSHHYCHWRV